MKALKAIAKSIMPPQLVRQKLNRRGRGAALLTFDDGPCPHITPQVLDLLDRWNARGVFFVPGDRVPRAPNLLVEILKRGHRLGNHTYSHNVKSSFQGCVEEIERCQQTIFEVTGSRPDYFRPPQGKLTIPLLVAVMHCKLRTIRWTLDTGEYSYLRDASPEQLAKNLVTKVRERTIILSHDDAEQTPEMLRIALPQLVERGFDLTIGVECLG
ncbi:polysaccharide deacetylase family protein [Tautonia rosea]|uniref:polysaccharide deacetylase family protein n=1 Tax=Tautonia rosea TaxID=2728037 RepID=UPI0014739483|nr:polysaccharide deacetylase family protein [Tautonia rosea]